MHAELSSQNFRGVLCRQCSKPIRIPNLVLRKDSEKFGEQAASDGTQFQLVSRVFVLRCRSCERESIYSIDQIVDCTYTKAPASGRYAEAAV